MGHRSFGKRVSDDDEAVTPEEVTFDVGDCENLNGRSRVNGKLLMDLVAKVDSPSVGLQAEGITDVFGIVLRTDDGENPDDFTGRPRNTPAQVAAAARDRVTAGVDPTSSLGRLTEYLDDPDTYIEIEELAEIVGWLVEAYTNRPTQSANNSAGGTSSTKGSSKAERRLPAGSTAKSQRAGFTASSTASSSSSA